MSSGRKCKNCGSSDIEVDPARGDAVCTNCGSVLEDNIIVAEVEFQENAHGHASAIGQFVSAESKGGATGFGTSFHMGLGTESRDVTLRKAKQGITALSQQLRLNQHCIDIACNFFKMALTKQLTKGRPASHIHAACVYMTCRTEGTAHLLIDISDVLQICCYQLGRTYLRLSQALCINIPSIDPCLYILRFANKLEFGEKTHEVSMTALRLVQRMKRDSLHSGRRPSGLCGAALLIAARLHEFNRLPSDVVRIVKVHETTLRKRLLEFGETPSSALTLDEFLTVDLEEEQDPPAFKAARKRDKERLQKLMDEDGGETVLTQLQKEIEEQMERDNKKKRKMGVLEQSVPLDESELEDLEANKFALQSTLGALEEGWVDDPDDEVVEDVKFQKITKSEKITKGLGPDLISMGLNDEAPNINEKSIINPTAEDNLVSSLGDLEDFEDDEINSIIMTPQETEYKSKRWHTVNKEYLFEQKLKEAKLAKEREEGKPEKKKRKTGPKKKGVIGPSASAGEAIEKMLQEKKISNKINYDILKTLNRVSGKEDEKSDVKTPATSVVPESPVQRISGDNVLAKTPILLASPLAKRSSKGARSQVPAPVGLPIVQQSPQTPSVSNVAATPSKQGNKSLDDDAESEYYEDDADVPGTPAVPEMESISQMLRSQEDDTEYYGYDDY